MEDKISNCITGFRKSQGTQHSLVIMQERWKQMPKVTARKNAFK